MGNICGKQDDPFAQPGRRVGESANPQNNSKTVPVPKKVGGPGRTLGNGPQEAGSASAGPDEARRKAAEAAEVRYPWKK